MQNKLVEFYPIEPLYRKPNGQYVQDIDRDDLPFGFTPVVRSLVTLPPGQAGGNHSHSRQEGFIAMGRGLTLYWRDEAGELQSELMNPDDTLQLVVIHSLVPHAVKNESDHQAVLLEYADQTLRDSSYEQVLLVTAD